MRWIGKTSVRTVARWCDSVLQRMNRESISEQMAESVRRTLHVRLRRLGFDADLEEMFERYHRKRYLNTNRIYALIGALIYLLFLITDLLMIPEAIMEAVSLRLSGGVVILLGLLASQMGWVDKAFKWILSAGALYVHITVLTIGAIAAELGEFHYQSGSIISTIFLCMVLRIQFHCVLPFAVLAWLMQLIFLFFFFEISPSQFTDLLSAFSFITAISLLVNYRVEYETRRTFLQQVLLTHEQEGLVLARNELERLSLTDTLTGLANRRSFDDFIDKEWHRAQRHQQPISLLMIDVDSFKSYNDNYGHQQGDDCLVAIADCLTSTGRRSYDLVARYGGEEFAFVLPQTDLENARQLAESARQQLYQRNIPHEFSSVADRVTISVGICCIVPQPGLGSAALVKLADTALYEAKRSGKNRVCNASPEGLAPSNF